MRSEQHLAGGRQQQGGGSGGPGSRLQQANGCCMGVDTAARELPTGQVVQPDLQGLSHALPGLQYHMTSWRPS